MNVVVRTGCRLHFGLFSAGTGPGRRYGGIGAMLRAPGVELVARPSDTVTCVGPSWERAEAFAKRYLEARRDRDLPSAAIELRSAVPDHVGLGSGTQLALAVAKALSVLHGERDTPATELAHRVGRGRRSAIGTHGFDLGGLILEGGKRSHDEIGALQAHWTLPSDWHAVLLIPAEGDGLHGPLEEGLFERREVIPASVSAELCRCALLELAPAAVEGDFVEFSEAVHRFNRQVGECFARWQTGGAYATPRLAETVAALRSHGVRGVGQSSWGPALFALAESEDRAFQVGELVSHLYREPATIHTAPFADDGAMVKVIDS